MGPITIQMCDVVVYTLFLYTKSKSNKKIDLSESHPMGERNHMNLTISLTVLMLKQTKCVAKNEHFTDKQIMEF